MGKKSEHGQGTKIKDPVDFIEQIFLNFAFQKSYDSKYVNFILHVTF